MLNGIDTSIYQGVLAPGVYENRDFWIGKVTQGTTFIDPQFQTNRESCINNAPNTVRGGYHFANYTDPVQEAAFFYTQFKPQPGEFMCLDVESPTLVGTALVDWCVAFAKQIIVDTGKAPLVYMDISLCNAHDWSSLFSFCGLWLAAPSIAPTANAPIKYEYVMQQTGTIVEGAISVDTDVFFGTKEELQAYGIPFPEAQAPAQSVPVVSQSPVTSPAPTSSPTPTPAAPTAPVVPTSSSKVSVVKQQSAYGIGGLMILTSLEKYFTGDHTLSQYLTTVQGATGGLGLAVIAIRADLAQIINSL